MQRNSGAGGVGYAHLGFVRGKDELVSRVKQTLLLPAAVAALTVFDNGGHWFHTGEELAFLDRWTRENI